jgi:hypothetical protein
VKRSPARVQSERETSWGIRARSNAIDGRPIPGRLLSQEGDDARVSGKQVRAPPDVQHRLVKHAANLLHRIGDPLSGGGEHRTLDLLVAEAGEYGDDDEDERGDEEGQLAAKRLLREE